MSSTRLLTLAFAGAALANLAFGLGGFALYVHLPGYLHELGAREGEIGLVMASSSLSAIVLVPWLGLLMDLRGRRGILVAAAIANATAMGMYWTVDAIGPALYAIRLLHGISGATLYAALFTYAADHVPELRRTEGLALFGTSGLIPIALGAVLGDWLLEGGSYRTLFQGSFLCALTAVGLCALLHEAPHKPVGWEPPRGLSASLRQPDLTPVWCVAALFFAASALVFTFLKTHVLAIGQGSVGPFFCSYAAIAIALRLFLGSLPDRIGAERVLGPALCGYALGLVLLGSTLPGPLTLVSAGLLCGAGHGYAYPILFSLVVRRARASERGTSLAIYTAIEEASFLVGSPLLGWVIQQVGYFATFSATGLCVIAGAAVFRLWDRAARPAPSHARWP